MPLPIQLILSDGGDVLLDTSTATRVTKQVLDELLRRYDPQVRPGEGCRLFRPYKDLSHTRMSYAHALECFFREQRIPCSAQEFMEREDALKARIGYHPELFPGVTQALESIHTQGLPFIIVSDTTATGQELLGRMRRLIIDQLEDRGAYREEAFRLDTYVTGCITSKDVGVKKPAGRFIDAVRSAYAIDNPGQALFVGHAPDEILGFARQGFPVAILPDPSSSAGSTYDPPGAYHLKRFPEIVRLIE